MKKKLSYIIKTMQLREFVVGTDIVSKTIVQGYSLIFTIFCVGLSD